MTHDTPPSPEPARRLRQAAERFTHTLAAEALLADTARVEAVIHAAAADAVFRFEAALRRAWPIGQSVPPHEVVWATASAPESEGGTRLQLRAFDGAGRLLLRRAFGPKPDARP
jgi:hypothetical protein